MHGQSRGLPGLEPGPQLSSIPEGSLGGPGQVGLECAQTAGRGHLLQAALQVSKRGSFYLRPALPMSVLGQKRKSLSLAHFQGLDHSEFTKGHFHGNPAPWPSGSEQRWRGSPDRRVAAMNPLGFQNLCFVFFFFFLGNQTVIKDEKKSHQLPSFFFLPFPK